MNSSEVVANSFEKERGNAKFSFTKCLAESYLKSGLT
jgi:hypothetical protein